MSKACWIGISARDIRYSDTEGLGFIALLETGAYIETAGGQKLQRIVSGGRMLGIGEVVLHNIAGIEVHEGQLEPIIDSVRTELQGCGVHGAVRMYIEHVDPPETITLH